MAGMMPSMTEINAREEIANNFSLIMIGSLMMHFLFGITVGIITSLLSIRYWYKLQMFKV